MLSGAMTYYDDPLVLALVRGATGTVHNSCERKVDPFFEQPEEKWRNTLYATLINTCWTDTRTGLEYGYTFRGGSAVVAFLTGIRGGHRGNYMSGPYCTIMDGDWERGDFETPGIEFVKSLGFRPGELPRNRPYTGAMFVVGEGRGVPFPCLPKELQVGLRMYADGGEGLAALPNRLAPCKVFRTPDPDEEHDLLTKQPRRN
jgi:hypothetical protein